MGNCGPSSALEHYDIHYRYLLSMSELHLLLELQLEMLTLESLQRVIDLVALSRLDFDSCRSQEIQTFLLLLSK